jgi:hypothetical protein
MYEFDHMLNGRGSRQHHQDMIQEAQHEKFARDVKIVPQNHTWLSSLRVILTALISLIVR